MSWHHALFCDESLEKIDAKDGILSLASVDYFGTNEYFSENDVTHFMQGKLFFIEILSFS